MSNVRIFCRVSGFSFIPLLLLHWLIGNHAADMATYSKAAISAVFYGLPMVGIRGE